MSLTEIKYDWNFNFHLWTIKYEPMIGNFDSFEQSKDLMIWKITITTNYGNLLKVINMCDLYEWIMNNCMLNVKVLWL